MTDAEMEYLNAIKADKKFSGSLLFAERAFQLMHDCIEWTVNE